MIVVALNGFTNRDTSSSVAGFTRTVLEHEPGPAADALFLGMGGERHGRRKRGQLHPKMHWRSTAISRSRTQSKGRNEVT